MQPSAFLGAAESGGRQPVTLWRVSPCGSVWRLLLVRARCAVLAAATQNEYGAAPPVLRFRICVVCPAGTPGPGEPASSACSTAVPQLARLARGTGEGWSILREESGLEAPRDQARVSERYF